MKLQHLLLAIYKYVQAVPSKKPVILLRDFSYSYWSAFRMILETEYNLHDKYITFCLGDINAKTSGGRACCLLIG